MSERITPILAIAVALCSIVFAPSLLLTNDFLGYRPEQFSVGQGFWPVQPAGLDFAIWDVIAANIPSANYSMIGVSVVGIVTLVIMIFLSRQSGNKPMKKTFALLALSTLVACSGTPNLEDETLSDRQFNLEEFFDGKTIAHGQFQDVFGNIQRRFDVQITGTWDGRYLKLVEDFTYDDGETEQRIWTLEKTGEDTWKGTAPGVLEAATGRENGDTFNWTYRIDLPVRKGTMRVKFDDWMWLLTNDRVLNRAYVSRFGVRLGEAIIVFEKK